MDDAKKICKKLFMKTGAPSYYMLYKALADEEKD
jgi:hypothetical protein